MRERLVCEVRVDDLDKGLLIIKPSHSIVDPRLVGVIPNDTFKDNSVYEFEFKDIKGVNTLQATDIKTKYISAPNPCYVDLKDVTSLANGLKLDDESVLYHIREACRHANHILREYNSENPMEQIILDRDTIKDDNYKFYMFIKYKALKDCLLDFYIKEAAKPNRIKNQTGDLMYEHDFDLKRIKDLLDDIEKEYEDWQDEIVTITADPKAVLRGKYAYNKYMPTHLTCSGFDRDKTPVGYDIYSRIDRHGRR